MDVFSLTRALVDIESITGNEERVGWYLQDCLRALVARHGGVVETMEVEPRRFNVFAQFGERLDVTLSTHLDTVPPFAASHEDDSYVWGRGACDAKGIIAAMIQAALALLESGESNFGLLLLVGEERNSVGAYKAARAPRGSRYLINGEPTDNKLALGSKGALRYEVVSTGKMAHSAYPELGDSAIDALLDALDAIRRVPLPQDALLGKCTMNIGTISGGRAPNVIADASKAEVMVRLVDDPAPIRDAFARAVGNRAQLNEVLCIPAIRFRNVDGMPTTVVSFTTDIPMFGGTWGEPLLLGPGSIHVAHTADERISKRELAEAVTMYASVVRRLQS